MATGVVTTDTVTGATPAAFLVHWQDRHDYGEIAAQEAAAFPDVLLGGGALYLTPLLGDTPYVTDAAGLAAAGEGPLLGLFADDSLPYVYDGLGDAPSLAEMTAAALEHLAADPDGFFLMVEGARIDHGSHLDDEDRVHPETAAFDAAVAVGVDWAADQDDVTLIVTADHECGGMQVAETGTPGETPETSWRWGAHTNADAPIFAMGDLAAGFDGERLDGLWVNAVLAAAIEQRAVVEPHIVPLVDGWLDDIGDPVTVQTLDTDYGAGFDQLDAMRVTADADGVRVGIDGVFEIGRAHV